MEHEIVSGIAYARNEAKLTYWACPTDPAWRRRFSARLKMRVNVDMIVQNMPPDGKTTDVTFTIAR